MCGRFTLHLSSEALTAFFEIQEVTDIDARFNIAPTQNVVAVLQNQQSNRRYLHHLRWGLIPAWAKDASMGTKLINARAETAAQKPAFRSAFKHRRCLIVADGFYEWQKQGTKKQPFYFHLRDGQPFAFAGLWERWRNPDKEDIDSCTILTTGANELMQPIHDRMPVILHPEDYNLWLDPQVQTPELLQPLLQPYPTAAMTAYPVSTWVNNARHDDSKCIVPVSDENFPINQLN
ncbi:MAG TPA: SOS response-associated peptidase [Nostocaceae cyanobacterium]|nr:SOS response-associated peptidase [Nostocaceae cyanobacterium]